MEGENRGNLIFPMPASDSTVTGNFAMGSTVTLLILMPSRFGMDDDPPSLQDLLIKPILQAIRGLMYAPQWSLVGEATMKGDVQAAVDRTDLDVVHIDQVLEGLGLALQARTDHREAFGGDRFGLFDQFG